MSNDDDNNVHSCVEFRFKSEGSFPKTELYLQSDKFFYFYANFVYSVCIK